MAEGKSTLRQALEAAGRAQKRVSEMREQGQMIMGEVVRTLLCSTTAGIAGFADQRFGSVDAETGIRVHRTNGAPTTLLAGAGMKVASGFGGFGKFQDAGFACGDGGCASAFNTWGRMAGERLRRKAERSEQSIAASSKPEPEKKVASK